MKIILSVDDEPSILLVRRMVLQQTGYQVLDAANGVEALQIFGNSRIDLVLLDYYMPDMNGDAVATQMKCTKPQVPIIVVSASMEGLEHLREKSDGFVCKGQGPELLLAEIKRFLSVEKSWTRAKIA